jgi:site-specific DNA-methyltransferase (adenine-specific)
MHPTQKPLELMKYLISTYSNKMDMVLDNTMGSGTTCLTAKELNRKFIGIEKEPKYYEIACQRCGF